MDNKQFEDAVKFRDKSKTVTQKNEPQEFWYKKGFSLYELGQYEDALECLDKDLQVKPNYVSNYTKGAIYLILKKYNESLECFNKAIEQKQSEILKYAQQGNQWHLINLLK